MIGMEIAHLNVRECNGDIFPLDLFDVCIYDIDNEPPQFHIMSNDWDVSFKINDGEIHYVNQKGNDIDTYQYIMQNVKKWLDLPNVIIPRITNRENAISVWLQLHS